MNETIVRISEIELNGFKNTGFGRIEMPSTIDKNYFSYSADILGIYGQNGSGKTSVIEAMSFIQMLLTGNSLPLETIHYLSKEEGCCRIFVKFIIASPAKTAMAEYSVQFSLTEENELEISKETLSSSLWNGTRFEGKKTLIDYSSDPQGPLFTPKYRLDQLVRKNSENRINLTVAKKLALKNKTSFFFGSESRNVFLSAPESVSEDYAFIISSLHQYASINLFVISSAHSGSISMNFMLPLAFRLDLGNTIAKGDLPVRLDEPSVISSEHFQIISRIIKEMNVILGSIIPGFSIGIHDFGQQLLTNGTAGHKIELISKRGDVIIPLNYESEGIIKIISVLNVLICVYNQPSACLVIDELDSGIYEYLLGELLSVFEKGAKGQLIFTSHNLRALEMLHKRSIVFSTANPSNRYIRLQNVKNNNNLRDLYLRSITLGGQKEEVYAETDSVEIGRAFRQAGKAVWDGTKN